MSMKEVCFDTHSKLSGHCLTQFSGKPIVTVTLSVCKHTVKVPETLQLPRHASNTFKAAR